MSEEGHCMVYLSAMHEREVHGLVYSHSSIAANVNINAILRL